MWRNTVVREFAYRLRRHNDGQCCAGRPLTGFYGLDLYSMHPLHEACDLLLETLGADRPRGRSWPEDPIFGDLRPSHMASARTMLDQKESGAASRKVSIVMAELTGRSAVVTGGARGIGAAVVAALAKERLSVVAGDLVESQGNALAESLGPKVIFRRPRAGTREHSRVFDTSRPDPHADDRGDGRIRRRQPAAGSLRPAGGGRRDGALPGLRGHLL